MSLPETGPSQTSAPGSSIHSPDASLPEFRIPDFNTLARPYQWLECLTFGPLLQRCRTHFLEPGHLTCFRHCHRALVLGDGDGRFTAALMRSLPGIRVHAVDVSPAMLAVLARRLTRAGFGGRLSTELADLRRWRPASDDSFDLVASHFFLDCLTTSEVKDLSARLEPSLAPGSQWLVSDFALPSTTFGHLFATPVVAALYLVFRLLTGLRVDRLPDHGSALNRNGWRLSERHNQLAGLLFSELWVQP